MKKLLSFLSIIGIILVSNCSRIPENNDPVIGIWSKVEVKAQSETAKSTVREEWIFNDAYLGRYHSYNNGERIELTDFQWEAEDGVYTITYPGLENKENDIVTMKDTEKGKALADTKGQVLALRE